VAAVSPRCDPEPVRTFGTFTGDLQRLADWVEQCRIRRLKQFEEENRRLKQMAADLSRDKAMMRILPDCGCQ
jgi:hypothetical protein